MASESNINIIKVIIMDTNNTINKATTSFQAPDTNNFTFKFPNTATPKDTVKATLSSTAAIKSTVMDKASVMVTSTNHISLIFRTNRNLTTNTKSTQPQ